MSFIGTVCPELQSTVPIIFLQAHLAIIFYKQYLLFSYQCPYTF